MLSQSINTEIIKCPDTITQSTLSKTFALLLIEDHEMIEGLIQRGEGRHYGYCHRRHAVMILFSFFSSLQHKVWVRVLCSLPFALYVNLGIAGLHTCQL